MRVNIGDHISLLRCRSIARILRRLFAKTLNMKRKRRNRTRADRIVSRIFTGFEQLDCFPQGSEIRRQYGYRPGAGFNLGPPQLLQFLIELGSTIASSRGTFVCSPRARPSLKQSVLQSLHSILPGKVVQASEVLDHEFLRDFFHSLRHF